jgi:hypothetical protein
LLGTNRKAWSRSSISSINPCTKCRLPASLVHCAVQKAGDFRFRRHTESLKSTVPSRRALSGGSGHPLFPLCCCREVSTDGRARVQRVCTTPSERSDVHPYGTTARFSTLMRAGRGAPSRSTIVRNLRVPSAVQCSGCSRAGLRWGSVMHTRIDQTPRHESCRLIPYPSLLGRCLVSSLLGRCST